MFSTGPADPSGSQFPRRLPGPFALALLEWMLDTYLDGRGLFVVGTLAAWVRRSSALDGVLCLVFTLGSASTSALNSATEQGGFLMFEV